MTYTIPPRIWQDEHQPALIPHPKPEVPARVAAVHELPAAAKRMRDLAVEHGWTVVATYARGTTLSRKPKVVDSLALRMRRGGTAAVASWVDGKWVGGVAMGAQLAPRRFNAGQMKELITS